MRFSPLQRTSVAGMETGSSRLIYSMSTWSRWIVTFRIVASINSRAGRGPPQFTPDYCRIWWMRRFSISAAGTRTMGSAKRCLSFWLI